jgi:hypothetical protein
MSCKPNYDGILKAKREANERALKFALAILGAIVVTFFGLRMCNQTEKVQTVAQHDFDYLQSHAAQNADVKAKYDALAEANNGKHD